MPATPSLVAPAGTCAPAFYPIREMHTLLPGTVSILDDGSVTFTIDDRALVYAYAEMQRG